MLNMYLLIILKHTTLLLKYCILKFITSGQIKVSDKVATYDVEYSIQKEQHFLTYDIHIVRFVKKYVLQLKCSPFLFLFLF